MNERIRVTTNDLLQVEADVLVIEDSGWLTAARGLAATIDGRYPALRAAREQAVTQHGGMFALGTALAFPLDKAEGPRAVIWAVTSGSELSPGQPNLMLRATPLDVAAATRAALREADAIGARRVALPLLGTKLGAHVLPPVPKKLPRYVMAAAQTIALDETIATTGIDEVLWCLSQRDYAIVQELLGLATGSADDREEG